jgi:hypothetical protein
MCGTFNFAAILYALGEERLPLSRDWGNDEGMADQAEQVSTTGVVDTNIGVIITGYTIIVIVAVAIDPAMNATICSISPALAASPAHMIAIPRLI